MRLTDVDKLKEFISDTWVLDRIEKLPTVDLVKNKLQRAVDGKTEEEIYDFLDWLMYKYANQYTDSRGAVIQWLKEDDK